MPRPGTPVIPPGWSQHHRPTVNKTMTARIILQRPPSGADAAFNPTTGKSEYPVPVVLWPITDDQTGLVRIQRIARRGSETEVGNRFAEIQMYQISLPAEVVEVEINDQVRVVASGDDTNLNGLLLRIVEVRGGSLIWSRDILAEEVTPTRR